MGLILEILGWLTIIAAFAAAVIWIDTYAPGR